METFLICLFFFLLVLIVLAACALGRLYARMDHRRAVEAQAAADRIAAHDRVEVRSGRYPPAPEA